MVVRRRLLVESDGDRQTFLTHCLLIVDKSAPLVKAQMKTVIIKVHIFKSSTLQQLSL